MYYFGSSCSDPIQHIDILKDGGRMSKSTLGFIIY